MRLLMHSLSNDGEATLTKNYAQIIVILELGSNDDRLIRIAF